jgi:DnaJ-class molecular chaperone
MHGIERDRPVGICARCHRVVRSFEEIGKKCARPLPAEKKCPGIIRTAIDADQSSQCPPCLGSGRIDDNICEKCSGEGWVYVR